MLLVVVVDELMLVRKTGNSFWSIVAHFDGDGDGDGRDGRSDGSGGEGVFVGFGDGASFGGFGNGNGESLELVLED